MKFSGWLFSQIFSTLAGWSPISSWQPLQSGAPHLPLPVRVVHQFPTPTYLQSIYVRANGDILATTVWPNASIYRVTGAHTGRPETALLYSAPAHLMNVITNVVETTPDMLVFLGGNQSNLGIGINGTFGVYELDLGDRDVVTPHVRQLVHMPDAGLVVGLEPLPAEPTTLLVSDSTMGIVWRVDTLAQTCEKAITDTAMASPPWAASQFGVNCLRIRHGHLYWSNSYEATVYRLAITDQGDRIPGATASLFVRVHSIYLDSFVFGPHGHGDILWAATNADNRVVAVPPGGPVTIVAGEPDKLTLAGSVAPAFGTLRGDTHMLYVATSGAMVFPINGTVIEGGKIVAIDTRGFFK